MTGRVWVWPLGGTRWRKPVLIGASVAAHVLVLGVLVASGVGNRMVVIATPPPPLYVEIEPRPLLEDERPRPRPTPIPETPADKPPAPAATPRTLLNFRLPFQRERTEEEEQRPSPPAPRLAAPAPGLPAPPASADPWQVRPETMGDRVGRGLRTRGPGCASPQLLTREERAVCEDRFGERAAAARPIEGTGNPERDAQFAREGARALAEYEARRRPLSGGVGVVGPQDGPGSNFGMGVAGAHLEPALRPDSTANVRTRRDRIREAEED
jgi:hypothetical protein